MEFASPRFRDCHDHRWNGSYELFLGQMWNPLMWLWGKISPDHPGGYPPALNPIDLQDLGLGEAENRKHLGASRCFWDAPIGCVGPRSICIGHQCNDSIYRYWSHCWGLEWVLKHLFETLLQLTPIQSGIAARFKHVLLTYFAKLPVMTFTLTCWFFPIQMIHSVSHLKIVLWKVINLFVFF